MVTTEVLRGAGMRGMLGAFEQKSSEMHSLALKSWIVNVLIRDGISRLSASINIPAFHRSLKVIHRDIIRRRSHEAVNAHLQQSGQSHPSEERVINQDLKQKEHLKEVCSMLFTFKGIVLKQISHAHADL